MIMSNLMDEPQRSKVHIFSTFFWRRLTDQGNGRANFANVSNWSRKIDIFERDLLFIPINENLHWSLAIIYRPKLVCTVSVIHSNSFELAMPNNALPFLALSGA